MRHAYCSGRANRTAQMAAYTFCSHYTRLTVITECDGLMSAVHTRHIASAATDTFVPVDFGEHKRGETSRMSYLQIVL